MDFKPPKHNESRGTARNCRKTRYTRNWTTMDHQRRSVISGTIQITLGSSFDKKESFQPVRDTFRPFWLDSPSNTESQTLYERLLERKLDMGQELPEQKKEERKANTVDLANATTFVRPRHIPITEKNILDIFEDSSLSAYAAVAYFDGPLYMAKTRLAPVSPKTIHELELMAMALDSQLGKFLQQSLQHLPIVVETTYWSDSQVCLVWLKSTKTLKTFVRNRVNMINYKCNFFFIPTDHNPADIATRISQPKKSRQQLWWHGPSLRVLEELKTTYQDVSEPLEYATFIPRKQEERPEGKPEDTLETKTQAYAARQGSLEDTLNTDHTQRSKRITAKLGKPEMPCIKTT